eukprot:6334202-Prorocentrum_lima.AAC.1
MLDSDNWLSQGHPLINWVPGNPVKLVAFLFIYVGHWQGHGQYILQLLWLQLLRRQMELFMDFLDFIIQ